MLHPPSPRHRLCQPDARASLLPVRLSRHPFFCNASTVPGLSKFLSVTSFRLSYRWLPLCCSSGSYADSSVVLTLVPLFHADSLFLWSRSCARAGISPRLVGSHHCPSGFHSLASPASSSLRLAALPARLVPLGPRSHASPASSLICSHSLVFRFRPLGLRSHASPASSPLVVAQRRGAGLAPWTYALSVASMSGSSFSAASRDISSACPMQVRVYIAQMSCVRTGGRRGRNLVRPRPCLSGIRLHLMLSLPLRLVCGTLAFSWGKVWDGMVGVLALSRHVCACASRV